MVASLQKDHMVQSRDTKTLWNNKLWLFSKVTNYDPQRLYVGVDQLDQSQNTLNSTSRVQESSKINPRS